MRFGWDVNNRHPYDFKGTSRVLGVNSAKINHFIAVMLMIRADEKKLPALMIFKENNGVIPYRVRDTLRITSNVVIKASKSGYINDDILSD